MCKLYSFWSVFECRILLNQILEGFFELSSQSKLVFINRRFQFIAETLTLIKKLIYNYLARYFRSRVGKPEAYVQVFIWIVLHDLVLISREHKCLISLLLIFKLIFSDRIHLQSFFQFPLLLLRSRVKYIKNSLAVTDLITWDSLAKVANSLISNWRIIELF